MRHRHVSMLAEQRPKCYQPKTNPLRQAWILLKLFDIMKLKSRFTAEYVFSVLKQMGMCKYKRKGCRQRCVAFTCQTQSNQSDHG